MSVSNSSGINGALKQGRLGQGCQPCQMVDMVNHLRCHICVCTKLLHAKSAGTLIVSLGEYGYGWVHKYVRFLL